MAMGLQYIGQKTQALLLRLITSASNVHIARCTLYTLHGLQCRGEEGGISAGAAGHTLQRGVGTGAPGSNTALAGELLFLRLWNIVCMTLTHRRADPSAGQKMSYFATYVKSGKVDREVTSCFKPDLLKGTDSLHSDD